MIKEIMNYLFNQGYEMGKKNSEKITKEEYDNHDCKEEGCQGCAEWFEQNPKEQTHGE